jgi:predicted permease
MSVLRRFRNLFRRRRVDAEIEEELHFHLEARTRRNLDAGMSLAEARSDAAIRFGGALLAREKSRDADLLVWLDTAVQDLRYSLRGMRRSPGFNLIAVVTLALATGAISTVFNLANGFLFRRLPVEEPGELVHISATRRHENRGAPVSWPDYVHFRDRTKTLTGLIAHYSTAPLFVTVGNRAQEINGSVVSANYFPLLGVKPAFGRFFRHDEDEVPDRDRVAVISYGLWRQWFAASPDVLGASVQINGVPFTVIGVVDPKFHGLLQNPSEIYIPLMMMRVGYRWCDDSLSEACTDLDMTGRLAPGRTVEEVQAEFAALVPPAWEHAQPGDNEGIAVRPERGTERSNATITLLQLLLLVGGVLLAVSCANLAGLLLARNAARLREFSIRASLGAGRFRLVRQLATESVLLALIGGIAGVLFSAALTNVLQSKFYSIDDEGHPLFYDFSLDPWVVFAVLAIGVGAGLVFGILPAIRATSAGPVENLKRQSSAVSGRARLGHWLVGAQAALAVALAAISGLLIGSARIMAAGTNFEPTHVALMRLRPRLLRYPPQRAQKFQHDVIRRLEQVPGVESASMVGTGAVLNGGRTWVALPASPERRSQSGWIDVGPKYFQTLRTPVLRGREFDERDNLASPKVAIVNRILAGRLWPNGNAIGAALLVAGTARQVVGIVEDLPPRNRLAEVTPYVFEPYWQHPGEVDARLCVRVRGDPTAMLPRLAREVNRVDPDVPIAETITLMTQLEGSFRPLRVTSAFLSYAAGLTILLSALGLYGALAFAVSRRTKEIGIRMAVGAEARSVLAMVVGEGMTMVLAGACVGLGLALAGSRLVRHLLLVAPSRDVTFYMGAALLVSIVGLLACCLPARRAAAIEPVSALRED